LKKERNFFKTVETLPLPAAKDKVIDLLSLFVQTDPTFTTIPFW